MAQTMRQVEGGALASRVGPVASADEIGALAGMGLAMLDATLRRERTCLSERRGASRLMWGTFSTCRKLRRF